MGLFRIAMRAVEDRPDSLKESGTFKEQANENHMLTRNELYSYLKYDPMTTPWPYPSSEREC